MEEAALRAIVDAWTGVGPGIKWDDDLVLTVAGRMVCAFERPPLASAVG